MEFTGTGNGGADSVGDGSVGAGSVGAGSVGAGSVGAGSVGGDSVGDDSVGDDSGGYDSVGAGGGSIGAGSNKKNRRAQLKEQAALKKAEASSSKASKEPEPTFKQLLGIVNSLIQDHTIDEGVISEVMDQGEEDICWAIVLTRLLQAIHNKGVSQDLQLEFSIRELVGHIKRDSSKSFALPNLKLAFKHIREKGILKESVGNRTQSVGARGNRVHESFDRIPDVDAAYVREKLDEYPVGLLVEMKLPFTRYKGEDFFHLPNINRNRRLHCILLIGYGRTDEGEDYFIGQNSHGVNWGCKGYIKLIIMDKCDIICVSR